MIEYRTGNIWDAIDSGEAQAIVIPVNTVGVMGAGLAKQAKERGYYNAYYKSLPSGGGCVIYHAQSTFIPSNVYFAATKEHYKNPSKLEWIDLSLKTIAIGNNGTVAVPALGCGLGGLNWSDVKPLCEKYLADSPVKFLIYEPR